MIEEDKIRQERAEINLLIEKGVAISVERTVYQRKKGIMGYIGKRVPVKEVLKYTIQEPTLSVLDLITAEQIQLNMNEEEMASDLGMQKAKLISKEQNRRMAKILALSVMGEDYFICRSHGSIFKYDHDDKTLNQLTEIFHKHIKPSRLLQYCILINTMSNLGDFINSIRLMSAARTTMPIRIEENIKV